MYNQRKLQSKDKTLTLGKETIIMGILNVTPDSFSDGGVFFKNVEKAVSYAQQMVADGATIIDIGGESTKPNVQQISAQEELTRVIPVLNALRKELPNKVFLSIDTYKAEVAQAALGVGADMINDVSGLQMDSQMPDVVAKAHVPVIVNHMYGTPKTMQKNPQYDDVIQDIVEFFQEKTSLLEKKGMVKTSIILDPGFGFGKTVEHNLMLLKYFSAFSQLGFSTLIGVSRKSTLGIVLQQSLGANQLPFPVNDRLEVGLAATAVAVLNGASMVRTHDVLQTKKFLSIIDKIKYA